MATITLNSGRRIGDYLRPYIVAEMNTSHFGDLALAKEMINQAKSAGCDCVKFQSWSADTLYASSFYKGNEIAKRIVSKFALGEEELQELAAFSYTAGIDFASTPYSIEEARFLVHKCNVPFIKIASMELNNHPYLTQLGELGVPLILSTGMGSLEEIKEAVETIESTGNLSLAILHCSSVYPAEPKTIRLRNITGLRGEFPQYPIGYSDHSVGVSIPAASISLGACLVEKHFTLDKTRIGMDNQMATEPLEMREMVLACHNVFEALGGTGRLLSDAETDQRSKMRRSIVSKVAISAGSRITEAAIELKRPGTGLPPSAYRHIIGKTVNKDIGVGSVIFAIDINDYQSK
jgi:sialic acid synthase SpsE